MTNALPPVDLGKVIQAARRGETAPGDVVWVMLDAVLVVPTSSDDGNSDGAFKPVVLPRGGVDYIVAFTTLEGAKATVARAPRVVSMKGNELVRAIADGFGLVIDPGGLGFELDPDLLATIRANI